MASAFFMNSVLKRLFQSGSSPLIRPFSLKNSYVFLTVLIVQIFDLPIEIEQLETAQENVRTIVEAADFIAG